ncbi:AAC(3) family N-acetyltransferase [Paracrocinitomix mangrovi]|uniref:AAC(3) family N-acetyltransferase n=1 Tax=Paracrocinitomix mangrovi TaxID=2862509 RepID=UPI001C8DFCD0|nr:AAC(3) family N-acetyltransferase [Paracrocinitomix mangrovi]UKN02162.1 AAC(3) family N-acetyltransferase [Paracrocinitomix mangrovi]
MALKDFIRKSTPGFILDWNRRRKKKRRNAQLMKQKSDAKAITTQDLVDDLKSIGIQTGDTVLVHSSLSKIGYLEDGPKTFVDALLQVVGENGNILMPTSPNAVYQLNYIRNTPFFDVKNSPSKTGKITEYFRTLPGAVRSIHPTEPVSAFGPRAKYFTEDHFGQITPYNENSPFYRVSAENGKILYVGVTLDNAGTNLHTLEDAVDFKFPIYYQEIFDFKVIDEKGEEHLIKTKVHDPEWSKKRKCDELIPMFEEAGVMKKVKIGQAPTLIVDAAGFFTVMKEQYKKNGVTMYTPKGS